MKRFSIFRKIDKTWLLQGIFEGNTRHDAVEEFAVSLNCVRRAVVFKRATGHPLTSYYDIDGSTVEVAVQTATALHAQLLRLKKGA